MSTHARPLAVWLAAADDEDLERLFAARGVKADAAWHDFFDAAEALLESTSIERALQVLTDDEARALLSGERPAVAHLIPLGLVDADGNVPPPVATVVAGHSPPPPAAEATHRVSSASSAAHAAEHAFTNVAAVGDLLLTAGRTPLELLTGGTVTAATRRRLTDDGATPNSIDPLLSLAESARLLRPDERALCLTRAGDAWLRGSATERWMLLATAFRDALPRGVRSPDGGWLPLTVWSGRHPWDPSWPQRCAALLDQAGLLGLVDDEGAEPTWAAPLREGRAADADSLRPLLPAEVDRLFLQNDLTAIAPGPLAPRLDVRLRRMAERESASQASSYRFTAESVNRALGEGEDEESILAFLGEISLTGIPQPLTYLITQTAARHGLVRVGDDPQSKRTRISSSDEHLLATIAVDQALRPLGLVHEGTGLLTRVSAETVYWALTDARYPATLVDPNDNPVPVTRALLDDEVPAPPASYGPLISRLREREGPGADAAWLDRELEAAVRQRAVIVVEVGMPDGSARALTLEASALSGGRLRGRDHAAGMERTLPVSSIRSARIANPSTL